MTDSAGSLSSGFDEIDASVLEALPPEIREEARTCLGLEVYVEACMG